MKLRIREIRKKRGMTISQLAEMVDKGQPYLSLIERGASGKRPSTELLADIAAALDVPASALIEDFRPVAVAGRVGAGAAIQLVDGYEKGDGLYHVACPDDLPSRRIVAVEVAGDSMAPLINQGDVLFFTRYFIGVDDAALNRVAICETVDGRALVKKIVAGRTPGTFDLISINPATPVEYGARLNWAAPLRRALSAEDVQRV